jgi:hypothetical protein
MDQHAHGMTGNLENMEELLAIQEGEKKGA